MTSAPPATLAGAIRLRVENRIAWVVFDLPGEKVNKLSSPVMEDLLRLLGELERLRDIDGAVITSEKDGVFIAGADVKQIESVRTREEALRGARQGQAVFQRVASLPFPVVAAIGGVCLGGGTELALACHGRIGSDHPRFQIGFPEVNLGILPGWTGTSKLPRLIGLQKALELILTGRALDARQAEKIGLLDAAVPHPQLAEQAAILVRKLAARTDYRVLKRRRRPALLERLLEGNPIGRAIVFRQARRSVLARSGGHYPAPLKILEVVRKSRGGSLERALELETEAVADLVVTAVSKNLFRLFFLSEQAKKDPGVAGEPASPAPLERVGVLGAGTMGGGIAWVVSSRDLPVRLKDVNPKALGAGLAAARRIYEGRKKRGRLTGWELDKKMTLIRPSLDWSGFGSVDLVIEAVVEDLEVKKSVFRELEPRVRPDCIIASNTSTLPISELARVLKDPGRMAGFHFFNPVDRMPLVEVIRGEATADRTIVALVAFAKRLGKTPVVVADGPGFLVNRVLGPYLNEAGHLLLETGDVEGIDRALTRFGMPMGPLRLLDEVGIDVAEKAGKVMAKAYGEDVASPGVSEKLVAAGRLGKKTGKGLYLHRGRKPVPDPEALRLLGIERRRRVAGAEAVERTIYPMVNEAARCLAQGVVRSAGELDLAMVMGIGFPPFRGGLLRFAEEEGLSKIVEALARLSDRLGPRFAPSAALLEKAGSGRFGGS